MTPSPSLTGRDDEDRSLRELGVSSHTPGPWTLGEYDENLGYDCMTGGVKVGPVYLDGMTYGQKSCQPFAPDGLARMMADARLIAAAPDMYEAIREFCARVDAGEVRSKRTYTKFAAIIERAMSAQATAKQER